LNLAFYKKTLGAAVANNYTFALCRLPKKQTIKTYIAFDKPLLEPVITGSNRCFVFSPFHNADEAFVLKQSVYYEDDRLINTTKSDIRQFGFLHQASQVSKQEIFYPSKYSTQNIGDEKYIHFVNQCVDAIYENRFKKIVAARCLEKKLPSNFDLIKYFQKLCDEYANAFIYIYSSPDIGTWIGASPEKLLTVENGTLQTVALAGTLEKNSEFDWSKKEREEQAYVENFISNVFSKIGVSDYKKGNVQTIAAGNLRHLQSTFSWQIHEETLEKDFSHFLTELNPTPAVCGLPKIETAEFLKQNEGFERRFYSGFAGIVDRETTQLFVNLRCMELMKEEVVLYAGAGITSDSIAQKELEETENKIETLGRFL
jgi:isochorismate synthase